MVVRLRKGANNILSRSETESEEPIEEQAEEQIEEPVKVKRKYNKKKNDEAPKKNRRRYSFFGKDVERVVRQSTTFYLEVDKKDLLRILAEGEGMTISNYVKHLIEWHIEERRKMGDID